MRTGVARTGVVGVLKGGEARADRSPARRHGRAAREGAEGLPFASEAKAQYLGKEVDVMHACGHDAHTAMLMATPRCWQG